MRRPIAGFVTLTSTLVTTLAVFGMRGFTVDDAWITARYAAHLGAGLGYRFNPHGPATDGVTPWPWALILAAVSGGHVETAWAAGRWIGAAAWIATIAGVAWSVTHEARTTGTLQLLTMWLLALSPACVAWSVSGMETGVTAMIVTFAVLAFSRPRPRTKTALALLSVAPIFRPELLPAMLTLALGVSINAHATHKPESTASSADPVPLPWKHITALAVAAAPFILTAVARYELFGSAAPLAVYAKPSDPEHGGMYAMASLLLLGWPLGVIAPLAWPRLAPSSRWIAGAWMAHVASVILVGGDWMPLSRLFIPLVPSLAIMMIDLHRTIDCAWKSYVRMTIIAAGPAFVWLHVMPKAARVAHDRHSLIQQLRKWAAPDTTIACIDIGWVGAAHPGTIFDMAGVTAPSIAHLPGGHTSKRIAPSSLAGKGVDTILFLIPPGMSARQAWANGRFSRRVETRMSRSAVIRNAYKPVGELRSTKALRYLLLARKHPAPH